MNPSADYRLEEVEEALTLLDGVSFIVAYKNFKGKKMFKLRQFNENS